MPKALKLLPPIALALLLAAALTVVHTTAARATGNQETLFQDDTQLHANPQGTLQQLKTLGAQRVRIFVTWSSLAPSASSHRKPHSAVSSSDPRFYPAQNWAFYDTVVRDAKSLGIGLDFTVTGPAPVWAGGSGLPRGAGKDAGIWKPSAREYGAFVAALGKRYSGSYVADGSVLPAVRYWAVWNEPNYGQDLAPQATNHSTVEVAPATYRGLVNAAWSALRARNSGHTHDTFLFGEIAPRGQTFGDQPGNFSGMVPLRFVHALYCIDGSNRPLRGSAAAVRGCPSNAAGSRRFRSSNPGLFQATGFAAHLYPQSQDPTKHTWPNPGADQYADLPNLPALLRLLDAANRAYGSHTRFRVYNTEFGYQTNPPLVFKTKQATAAVWINWAEYLSWRNPRIATYMQYGLVDPPLDNFPSALDNKNGHAKPTYYAFRMPVFLPSTTARRGHSLEVWGDVRPAHFVPGNQQVQIQFQRGSRGAFTTVKTVTVHSGTGYFDVRVTFPAGGSVRTKWFSPLSGGNIYSRTQKISVK
jgi:hypothetical protein